MASTDLDDLRFLTKLHDELRTSMSFRMLAHDDTLHRDFTALLGLSVEQTGNLNEALHRAREAMNALSVQNANLERAADGSLTVRVGALATGAAVYDELMECFTSTLGRAKSDALVRLLGDQLTSAFNSFGAEERSMTIAATLPGHAVWADGGYYLKDVRKTASGATTTMTYRFWGGKTEYMPARVRWVGEIIQPHIVPNLPPKLPE